MKIRYLIISIIVVLISAAAIPSDAQKLKNLGLKNAKDRLKRIVDETVSPKTEPVKETDKTSSGNKTLNKRLSKTEILETLDNANESVNSKDYSDARYSLQQALVEIEIQLGEEVLAEMPKSVKGQEYDPSEDMALSTGAGFIGLEIKRSYPSSNGDIDAIIANNSLIIGTYSMALANPQYMSQNENMKSVKVQGKRGILELDGDTYKLAVPFGQSSVFLLSCDTCNSESEIMGISNQFDIDKYLSILGEAPIQINDN